MSSLPVRQKNKTKKHRVLFAKAPGKIMPCVRPDTKTRLCPLELLTLQRIYRETRLSGRVKAFFGHIILVSVWGRSIEG